MVYQIQYCLPTSSTGNFLIGFAIFVTNAGFSATAFYVNEKVDNIKIKLNLNAYSSVDLVPFVDYLEKIIKSKIGNTNIEVQIARPNNQAVALLLISENGKVEKYIY